MIIHYGFDPSRTSSSRVIKLISSRIWGQSLVVLCRRRCDQQTTHSHTFVPVSKGEAGGSRWGQDLSTVQQTSCWRRRRKPRCFSIAHWAARHAGRGVGLLPSGGCITYSIRGVKGAGIISISSSIYLLLKSVRCYRYDIIIIFVHPAGLIAPLLRSMDHWWESNIEVLAAWFSNEMASKESFVALWSSTCAIAHSCGVAQSLSQARMDWMGWRNMVAILPRRAQWNINLVVGECTVRVFLSENDIYHVAYV